MSKGTIPLTGNNSEPSSTELSIPKQQGVALPTRPAAGRGLVLLSETRCLKLSDPKSAYKTHQSKLYYPGHATRLAEQQENTGKKLSYPFPPLCMQRRAAESISYFMPLALRSMNII